MTDVPDGSSSPLGGRRDRVRLRDCWWIFFLSTCIKILLLPSYRSTDFEVHRNWLAITHSLPVSKWYYESTSEWTLDYPPLFAWFEWLLSQFAPLFDAKMLKVQSLNYASERTILFQRFTVIVTDIVLFLGVYLFCSTWPAANTIDIAASRRKYLTILALVMLNPGLLIVDHIHFQYNGFLLGVFVISIALIRRGNDLLGGLVFAMLLMFKHIFLYVSPVYFVYLLRHYCYTGARQSRRTLSDAEKLDIHRRFNLRRFLGLGMIVLSAFALALLPVLCQSPESTLSGTDLVRMPFRIISQQCQPILQQMSCSPEVILPNLRQLASRLFPVQRGLVHAYWAPNVWALYTLFDKVLASVCRRTKLCSIANITASMTGGLVQEASFLVLPSVPTLLTALLTLAAMMPLLIDVWRRPHPRAFASAVTYLAFCSFMLGYHVHEKAILMVIIPLSLSSLESALDGRLYLLTTAFGHYSLLPLLFTSTEKPTKYLLIGTFSVLSFCLVDSFVRQSLRQRHIRGNGVSFSLAEKLLLVGLCLVTLFNEIIHPLLFSHLEFLPLLVTSTVCSVGLIYCWVFAIHQHMRRMEAVNSYMESPLVSASAAVGSADKPDTDGRFDFILE